jgi:hypothetical protein
MQISSAIPHLRMTDLTESIDFYITKVGLQLEFQYQDFYAGIRARNQLFSSKACRRQRSFHRFRGALTPLKE